MKLIKSIINHLTMSERDRYLSKSVDHADFESRLKNVNRVYDSSVNVALSKGHF